MEKALFLDRDGIINKDYGYVHEQGRFIFNEDIFDICSYAQKKGYIIIVITNQAGIARGYYSEKDFEDLIEYSIILPRLFKEHHRYVLDMQLDKVCSFKHFGEKINLWKKSNGLF